MKQFILLLLFSNLCTTLLSLGEKEKKELSTIKSTYESNFSNPQKLNNQLKVLNRISKKDHLDLESRSKVTDLRSCIESLLPVAELMSKTGNIDNPHCTITHLKKLYQSALDIQLESLPREVKQQVLIKQHQIRKTLLFKELNGKNQPHKLQNLNELTIYETDADGNTPLHIACMKEKHQIIHLFQTLEKDFFLEEDFLESTIHLTELKNNEGYTPFLTAAAYGNDKTVQTMLVWDDVNWNDTDANGNNALLVAVKHNNQKTIPTLLNYNFNIDTCNNEQETAVHTAVRTKDPQLLELLLQYYPELGMTDKDDKTPLDLLLSTNTFTTSDKKFVHILKQLKKRNAPLHALQNDKKAKFTLTINLDAKPPKPTKPKKTRPKQRRIVVTPKKAPRVLTAQQTFYQLMWLNQQQTLQLHIQTHRNKINMNYEDSETLHPLIYAVATNNLQLIRLLLKELSNPNHKSLYGHKHQLIAFKKPIAPLNLKKAPPFLFAYIFNHQPIVLEFIYSKGIDFNTSNEQGETILDFIINSPLYYQPNACAHALSLFIRNGAEYFKSKYIFKDDSHRNEVLNLLEDDSPYIIEYSKKEITLEVHNQHH